MTTENDDINLPFNFWLSGGVPEDFEEKVNAAAARGVLFWVDRKIIKVKARYQAITIYVAKAASEPEELFFGRGARVEINRWNAPKYYLQVCCAAPGLYDKVVGRGSTGWRVATPHVRRVEVFPVVTHADLPTAFAWVGGEVNARGITLGSEEVLLPCYLVRIDEEIEVLSAVEFDARYTLG
jgi:hypothetical protein